MPVMELETVCVTQAIQSTGASIEIARHSGTGPVLLAVVCPPDVVALASLNSPLVAMQLRGYAGSKVSA